MLTMNKLAIADIGVKCCMTDIRANDCLITQS